MNTKRDSYLVNRIREYANSEEYKKVREIVSTLNSDIWKIETRKNWKGTEIEGVLVADIGPINISLEDGLNRGVAFYLQIYDKEKEGSGRIGRWLMLHNEDQLYHEIFVKIL